MVTPREPIDERLEHSSWMVRKHYDNTDDDFKVHIDRAEDTFTSRNNETEFNFSNTMETIPNSQCISPALTLRSGESNAISKYEYNYQLF